MREEDAIVNGFRRHWQDVGLIVAVGSLVAGLIVGVEDLQLILLLSFATLLFHQFEEYRFPGGEPWILNEVSQPLGGPADGYPLNANSASIGNVVMWVPYGVAVFFPHVIWLGMAPLLMGAIGQFVVHVVQTNIKLKTIYNPGVFTVVFGWVPLAIWYLIAAYGMGVVDGWQWVWAVLYTVALMAIVGIGLTYRFLRSKNSPYRFTHDEMNRWDRERRLTRVGIVPLPLDSAASETSAQ